MEHTRNLIGETERFKYFTLQRQSSEGNTIFGVGILENEKSFEGYYFTEDEQFATSLCKQMFDGGVTITTLPYIIDDAVA